MFARSTLAHANGGMERHIHDLSESLADNGIDVSIITTALLDGRLIDNPRKNLTVHYVPNTASGKYTHNWWRRANLLFDELHGKRPFSLIHSQSAGGYGFMRSGRNLKYGTPVVTSLHGTSFQEFETKLFLGWSIKSKLSALKNLYAYLFRDIFYLNASDAIIATSFEQADVIERRYNINKNKINIIYNGIDSNIFAPNIDVSALKNSLGISPDKKIILCAARLIKDKGLQIAIEAFKRSDKLLEKAVLVIVGDGEYKRKLEKMSGKLALQKRVLFTGSVQFLEVPRYLNLADVFVNPTLRTGGLDLLITCAMSCEKLVVCSDIPSVKGIISNERNGLIFNRGSVESLSSTLTDIVNGKYDAKTIGRNARETVLKDLTVKAMTDKTMGLYQRIVHGGKS
jgi:glycosyltransferase involved in cell wall biosynthesis